MLVICGFLFLFENGLFSWLMILLVRWCLFLLVSSFEVFLLDSIISRWLCICGMYSLRVLVVWLFGICRVIVICRYWLLVFCCRFIMKGLIIMKVGVLVFIFFLVWLLFFLFLLFIMKNVVVLLMISISIVFMMMNSIFLLDFVGVVFVLVFLVGVFFFVVIYCFF